MVPPIIACRVAAGICPLFEQEGEEGEIVVQHSKNHGVPLTFPAVVEYGRLVLEEEAVDGDGGAANCGGDDVGGDIGDRWGKGEKIGEYGEVLVLDCG